MDRVLKQLMMMSTKANELKVLGDSVARQFEDDNLVDKVLGDVESRSLNAFEAYEKLKDVKRREM